MSSLSVFQSLLVPNTALPYTATNGGNSTSDPGGKFEIYQLYKPILIYEI